MFAIDGGRQGDIPGQVLERHVLYERSRIRAAAHEGGASPRVETSVTARPRVRASPTKAAVRSPGPRLRPSQTTTASAPDRGSECSTGGAWRAASLSASSRIATFTAA